MNSEALEIYGTMTTYEVVDLYYTARDSTVMVTTTFMSALFAYLAVAHFVSERLTRFQVVAISSIYTLFSFSLLSGIYSSMLDLAAIELYLLGSTTTLSEIVTYGFPTLLVVSWAVSILFMYQERGSVDT